LPRRQPGGAPSRVRGGRRRRVHPRRLRRAGDAARGPRPPGPRSYPGRRPTGRHCGDDAERIMSLPDFTELDLGPAPDGADLGAWREMVRATGKDEDALVWETPEGISVRPVYTAADHEGLDFLRTYPGLPPYLRGPYPTMYVN